jgi:hypothetical protein
MLKMVLGFRVSVFILAVLGTSIGIVGGAKAGIDFRPACQVKLLRVASVALDKEFAEKGKAVGVINEIVYNYNQAKTPRIVLLARLASDPAAVCFIDVRTTVEDEEEREECPDYKFAEIRTTCK